ncbi:MAG: flagellar basal body L-ring protein FlgH [Phycisphaerales bacterium]|nr:flagellar basal body L-ring protein FlgH [Phycisphaerales bacterium]
MRRTHLQLSVFALLTCISPFVHAQSLYLVQEQSSDSPDVQQPSISLEEASIYFISAPETRTIKVHDIVTIIIDENSSQTSSQKLETEKASNSTAELNAILSLAQLLETRLETSGITDTDLIDVAASRDYTGEGDYERKDKFSARIAATVLEVKPNGTLVLQAVKRISKDKEKSILTLSGLARDEDITSQNTILSSQLAGLNIILENEGDLKKAAEKGIITRVLDTVFAF